MELYVSMIRKGCLIGNMTYLYQIQFLSKGYINNFSPKSIRKSGRATNISYLQVIRDEKLQKWLTPIVSDAAATSLSAIIGKSSELMAHLVGALSSGLCRAVRPWFDSRLDR